VAGLVLHLREQDRLAPQAGRAADPVALGLHADDLAVGVLGDLAHEGLAVALRHPVARLDPLVARDRRVEPGLEVVLGGRLGECHPSSDTGATWGLRPHLLTDRSAISVAPVTPARKRRLP
jgi:hypothetical protein